MPDPGARIDPHKVSLHPARWEQDGLFAGAGLTRDEALARVPGIEQLWFPGSSPV